MTHLITDVKTGNKLSIFDKDGLNLLKKYVKSYIKGGLLLNIYGGDDGAIDMDIVGDDGGDDDIDMDIVGDDGGDDVGDDGGDDGDDGGDDGGGDDAIDMDIIGDDGGGDDAVDMDIELRVLSQKQKHIVTVLNEIPKFMLIGHGFQGPGNFVVPEKTIIVSTVEAGKTQFAYENGTFCKIFNLFLTNTPKAKNVLSDLYNYDKTIDENIRIYTPNSICPNLNILFNTDLINHGPMGYLDKLGNIHDHIVGKTGIFKYPIQKGIVFPKALYSNDQGILCKRVFKAGNDTQLSRENAMRGSVIKQIFDSEISLKKVVIRKGPGIYFFPMCRDLNFDPPDIKLLRQQSDDQQQTIHEMLL